MESKSSFTPKTFQRKVAQSFLKNWKSSPQHDAFITCGSKIFRAHKVLLAASSGYFYNVFVKQQVNISRLVLNTIDPNIMEILLDYIYTGVMNVDEEDINLQEALEESLEVLKMSDIVKHRSDIIVSSLCVQHYRYLWNLASHYQLKDVEKKIAKFVAKNLEACMKNDEFVQINLRQIIAVLSCEEIRMNPELVQTHAIYSWINFNRPGREKYITSLLSISKVAVSTRNRILTILEEGIHDNKLVPFIDKGKRANCEKNGKIQKTKMRVTAKMKDIRESSNVEFKTVITDDRSADDRLINENIFVCSSLNTNRLNRLHSAETFSVFCSEGFEIEEELERKKKLFQQEGKKDYCCRKMNDSIHDDVNINNASFQISDTRSGKFSVTDNNRILNISNKENSENFDESALVRNVYGLRPLSRKKRKYPEFENGFCAETSKYEHMRVENKIDSTVNDDCRIISVDSSQKKLSQISGDHDPKAFKDHSKYMSPSKLSPIQKNSKFQNETKSTIAKKSNSLVAHSHNLLASPKISTDVCESCLLPITNTFPSNTTTKHLMTVNSPKSDIIVHKVTTIQDDSGINSILHCKSCPNRNFINNQESLNLKQIPLGLEIETNASSIHHIKFSPKQNRYLSFDSDPRQQATAKVLSPGKISIKAYPTQYPIYPIRTKLASGLTESDKLRFLNLKERLEEVLVSLKSKLDLEDKLFSVHSIDSYKSKDDMESLCSTNNDNVSDCANKNKTNYYGRLLHSETNQKNDSKSNLNDQLLAESLTRFHSTKSKEIENAQLSDKNYQDVDKNNEDEIPCIYSTQSNTFKKITKQDSAERLANEKVSNYCSDADESISEENSYGSKSIADKTTSYENIFHSPNADFGYCLDSPESPISKSFRSESRLVNSSNFSSDLFSERKSAGNDAVSSSNHLLQVKKSIIYGSPEDENLFEETDTERNKNLYSQCNEYTNKQANSKTDIISNANPSKILSPGSRVSSYSEPNITYYSNFIGNNSEISTMTKSSPCLETSLLSSHMKVTKKVKGSKDTNVFSKGPECEDPIGRHRKCWDKNDMSYLPQISNHALIDKAELSPEIEPLLINKCKKHKFSYQDNTIVPPDYSIVNCMKDCMSNSSSNSERSNLTKVLSTQQDKIFNSNCSGDNNLQINNVLKNLESNEHCYKMRTKEVDLIQNTDFISKVKHPNVFPDFELVSSQCVSFKNVSGEVVAESRALLNFIYGDIDLLSVQEVDSFDKIFWPRIKSNCSGTTDSLHLEKTCKELLEKMMQQHHSKPCLVNCKSGESNSLKEEKIHNKPEVYSESLTLSSLHSLSDEELTSPSCADLITNESKDFFNETLKTDKYTCRVWSSEKTNSPSSGRSINLCLSQLSEKSLSHNSEKYQKYGNNEKKTKTVYLDCSVKKADSIMTLTPSFSNAMVDNINISSPMIEDVNINISPMIKKANSSEDVSLKDFSAMKQKFQSDIYVPKKDVKIFSLSTPTKEKKYQFNNTGENDKMYPVLRRSIKLKNKSNSLQAKFESGKAIVFLAKNSKGEFVRLPYCMHKRVWLSPMPARVPRMEDDYSSFYHKETIYFIGGTEGSIPRYWHAAFEYNCVNDFLRQLPDLIVARAGAGLNIVNNSLFVIGGEGLSRKALAQVETFDSANNCWRLRAPLLVPRTNMSVINLKQFLYVFGGTSVSNQLMNYPVLLSCERYDPFVDQWTAIADLPPHFEYYNPLSATINNKVYSLRIQNPDTVFRYSVSRDKWIVLHGTRLSLRRIGILLAGENKLYAMGICGKTMYSFDLHSYQWTIEAEFPDDMEWTVHAFVLDL